MTRRRVWRVVAVCGLALCVAAAGRAASRKPAPKEAKVEIGGQVRHRFLAGSYHGKVLIVNRAGKVLRTIAPLKGKPNTASSIVPLRGGNLPIGTGYGRSVVEVDKDKRIVWSIKGGPFHGTTAIQILD